MPQILGPALPRDLPAAAAEDLAGRLARLLAHRRPEHPLAALRIESDRLSHLAPGQPQRTFLVRPDAPAPVLAFPKNNAFHTQTLYPALADVRRHAFDGQDVLVLPGLVLSCGHGAPARAWETPDDVPDAAGLLVPDRPSRFARLRPAPAALAADLLDLPPGPLLAPEDASAHVRLAAACRLGPLAGALARAARARGLRALDLHVLGPWRILVAEAADQFGRSRTFPWALRRLPAGS